MNEISFYMSSKYSIIFLGNTAHPIKEDILEAFIRTYEEIGLSPDFLDIVESEDFDKKYSNKNPSFCFYIGKDDNPDKETGHLEIILNNGDSILPIYFNVDCFTKEIPKILHPINGVRVGDINPIQLANIALQGLRLLRKTRKIFISYKRNESSGVAIQLFEELIRRNFDPFIDTYSIPPTDDFQKELFHRMADCDVLIQLLTPNFHESNYCRDEIESANVKQIGVVQVVWPDCTLEKYDHLCIPFQLNTENIENINDSEKCRLSTPSLESLINVVESCRARNLAARQDSLLGEFIQEAKKVGKPIFKEKFYIIERDLNHELIAVYIPAVGVPTSYDYYESRNFKELLDSPKLNIYLLYDSLKVREEWLAHLKWLNSSLEVKTIPRNEFELWMKRN